MSDKISENQMNENIHKEEPLKPTSTTISDLEKLIVDTLDDGDMKDESLPVDETVIESSEQINQKEENPIITRTTRLIMEIIEQNELIEKAKRDKIKSIISKQEKILRKKETELDKQLIELNLLEKKARLTKKALKKAKELKLGTNKIALIQFDAKQTKTLRKTSKGLTEQMQSDIKNIKALIELLETTI